MLREQRQSLAFQVCDGIIRPKSRANSTASNSMSHEFYQIMVGSPTMSVHSWKQLALWSLEYSCLEEMEKTKAEELFRQAWDEFCDWVVEEHRSLFDFSIDGNVQTLSNDRAKEWYRHKLDVKH